MQAILQSKVIGKKLNFEVADSAYSIFNFQWCVQSLKYDVIIRRDWHVRAYIYYVTSSKRSASASGLIIVKLAISLYFPFLPCGKRVEYNCSIVNPEKRAVWNSRF